MIILILILILTTIVSLIAKWKIFNKVNKPGYYAIIPFYGSYMFTKTFAKNKYLSFVKLLSDLSIHIFGISLIITSILILTMTIITFGAAPYVGTLYLVMKISFIMLCITMLASFAIHIFVSNHLSKSFGKSELFTIGLVFLPPIFWCILGFDDSQYLDNIELNDKNLE